MQGDKFFRWRGGDVSRLESLFDAVIALALTLILVSVEVPETFDDLMAAFQRLPAFAFSFAVIIMCWYYHFLFHRRYGIEDYPLVLLNAVLMFIVIFYVYPLKFLAALMFRSAIAITEDQIPIMMYLYSGGFITIFVLILAMYVYAYTKREPLELDQVERQLTKQKWCELSIYIAVGIASLFLVQVSAPLAGMIYIAIGPLQGVNGFLWGRKIKVTE